MDEAWKQSMMEGMRRAGEAIRKHLGRMQEESLFKVSTFNYGIPADKEAEDILLDTIRRAGFPVRIVSEEAGIFENDESEYTVYVDPLDGSVNFSRGIPTFCIGIGVYRNDEPLLGIIYDINMNEWFVAERGKGITINGKSLEHRPSLSPRPFIQVEWSGSPLYESAITKLKGSGIRTRTAGSGVLALCYGSVGRGDGAVLTYNKPWDIAPGLVFARESGLEVKRFDGSDVDLSLLNQDIIAAPKEIFEKLQIILRR
jgi:myo-inositol-1(or 4)-monophosphatase